MINFNQNLVRFYSQYIILQRNMKFLFGNFLMFLRESSEKFDQIHALIQTDSKVFSDSGNRNTTKI